MIATRLTLLAHAATQAQRLAAFPRDEPVEAKQLAKAGVLAGHLGTADRVWTGPELRARQTAEALGLSSTVAAPLRDCAYGAWQGKRLDELAQHEPEGMAIWLSDPKAKPHGGESILDLLTRTGAWLDAYAQPGHTLAITHPAIIRAALVHILKAPPKTFWRIDVEPLSLTELRQHQDRWNLRSMRRLEGGSAT